MPEGAGSRSAEEWFQLALETEGRDETTPHDIEALSLRHD